MATSDFAHTFVQSLTHASSFPDFSAIPQLDARALNHCIIATNIPVSDLLPLFDQSLLVSLGKVDDKGLLVDDRGYIAAMLRSFYRILFSQQHAQADASINLLTTLVFQRPALTDYAARYQYCRKNYPQLWLAPSLLLTKDNDRLFDYFFTHWPALVEFAYTFVRMWAQSFVAGAEYDQPDVKLLRQAALSKDPDSSLKLVIDGFTRKNLPPRDTAQFLWDRLDQATSLLPPPLWCYNFRLFFTMGMLSFIRNDCAHAANMFAHAQHLLHSRFQGLAGADSAQNPALQGQQGHQGHERTALYTQALASLQGDYLLSAPLQHLMLSDAVHKGLFSPQSISSATGKGALDSVPKAAPQDAFADGSKGAAAGVSAAASVTALLPWSTPLLWTQGQIGGFLSNYYQQQLHINPAELSYRHDFSFEEQCLEEIFSASRLVTTLQGYCRLGLSIPAFERSCKDELELQLLLCYLRMTFHERKLQISALNSQRSLLDFVQACEYQEAVKDILDPDPFFSAYHTADTSDLSDLVRAFVQPYRTSQITPQAYANFDYQYTLSLITSALQLPTHVVDSRYGLHLAFWAQFKEPLATPYPQLNASSSQSLLIAHGLGLPLERHFFKGIELVSPQAVDGAIALGFSQQKQLWWRECRHCKTAFYYPVEALSLYDAQDIGDCSFILQACTGGSALSDEVTPWMLQYLKVQLYGKRPYPSGVTGETSVASTVSYAEKTFSLVWQPPLHLEFLATANQEIPRCYYTTLLDKALENVIIALVPIEDQEEESADTPHHFKFYEPFTDLWAPEESEESSEGASSKSADESKDATTSSSRLGRQRWQHYQEVMRSVVFTRDEHSLGARGGANLKASHSPYQDSTAPLEFTGFYNGAPFFDQLAQLHQTNGTFHEYAYEQRNFYAGWDHSVQQTLDRQFALYVQVPSLSSSNNKLQLQLDIIAVLTWFFGQNFMELALTKIKFYATLRDFVQAALSDYWGQSAFSEGVVVPQAYIKKHRYTYEQVATMDCQGAIFLRLNELPELVTNSRWQNLFSVPDLMGKFNLGYTYAVREASDPIAQLLPDFPLPDDAKQSFPLPDGYEFYSYPTRCKLSELDASSESRTWSSSLKSTAILPFPEILESSYTTAPVPLLYKLEEQGSNAFADAYDGTSIVAEAPSTSAFRYYENSLMVRHRLTDKQLKYWIAWQQQVRFYRIAQRWYNDPLHREGCDQPQYAFFTHGKQALLDQAFPYPEEQLLERSQALYMAARQRQQEPLDYKLRRDIYHGLTYCRYMLSEFYYEQDGGDASTSINMSRLHSVQAMAGFLYVPRAQLHEAFVKSHGNAAPAADTSKLAALLEQGEKWYALREHADVKYKQSLLKSARSGETKRLLQQLKVVTEQTEKYEDQVKEELRKLDEAAYAQQRKAFAAEELFIINFLRKLTTALYEALNLHWEYIGYALGHDYVYLDMLVWDCDLFWEKVGTLGENSSLQQFNVTQLYWHSFYAKTPSVQVYPTLATAATATVG